MQQYRSSHQDPHPRSQIAKPTSTIDPAAASLLESRINAQQIIIEQQSRSIRRLQSQLEQLENHLKRNS